MRRRAPVATKTATGSFVRLSLACALVLATDNALADTPSVGTRAADGTVSGPLADMQPFHVERRVGRLVPTGGKIIFRDVDDRRAVAPVPRLAPPRSGPAQARTARQRDWFDDVMDTLFGPEPAKPRRAAVARTPRVPSAVAATAGPLAPSGAAPPVASTAVTPAAAPAMTASSPATVTTASIPVLAPTSQPPKAKLHPGDAEAETVREAARAQTRIDLVKLELAHRSYDEPRIAGQNVFATKPDWRVLERGRDAWTDAELSASKAASFEANAYINDFDRMIVVAIAGTQDLRRDFIEADIWRALITAQSPQHFYLAKSYIRSVITRYQAQGYHTECVGHSLGGAACAYAASELGIRAIVVNPISAGKLPESARQWITNYVVDGDIAALVYAARGNGTNGDVQRISDGSQATRAAVQAKYGPLAGPILVIRDLKNSVKVHQIDRALDLIAIHAETERVR